MEPEAVAEQVPALTRMLKLRCAVNAFKGPVGCEREFRRVFEQTLGDERHRALLRDQLGVAGEASLHLPDLVAEAPSALSEAIASFETVGRGRSPAEGSARLDRLCARLDELLTSPDGRCAIDEALEATKMGPDMEGYWALRCTTQGMFLHMLGPPFTHMLFERHVLDGMLEDIDARLSRQLDEILHTPSFRALERSWRAVRYVLDHLEASTKGAYDLDLFHASLDELREEALGARPEGVLPGLRRAARYGLVCMLHELGPGDAGVLRIVKEASGRSPVIAAAHPSALDLETWDALDPLPTMVAARLPEALQSLLDQGGITLALGRVLLRLPYGPITMPVKRFNYEERVLDLETDLLHGSTAVLLAVAAARAQGAPRAARDVQLPCIYQFEHDGEVKSVALSGVVSQRAARDLAGRGLAAPSWSEVDDPASFSQEILRSLASVSGS
jgi:type VI secretion system protein ImpC